MVHTYYFPLNLYIICLVIVLILTAVLVFVNELSKRFILTAMLALLTGILASVLFMGMVGDYFLGTYVIFENTFLFFVLFALTLIYAGVSIVFAYNAYNRMGGVLDTRRFGL